MKKESSFLNDKNKLKKNSEFNGKCLNHIITWNLLLKVYALIPEREKLSIKTNQIFIYRFLRRKSYSFRTKTHIGQNLSEN